MDSLYEHISPNILPEFLGGQLSEQDAWDHSLEERIFKNDENFRNINFNVISSISSSSDDQNSGGGDGSINNSIL